MPRNAGQKYEVYIQNILKGKGLYPPVVSADVDAGFVHRGSTYYVEVKNSKAHDFGQKKLVWSKTGGWAWNETDAITALYDSYNVLSRVKSGFVPNKYTVPNDANFTKAHKQHDQKEFESGTIPITNMSAINTYYKKKNCYYIQIENRGFYHLERDVATLGTDPFAPRITLRLRAKTHRSMPHYNYSFFAVLVAYPKSLLASRLDIEENGGRKFPPIGI